MKFCPKRIIMMAIDENGSEVPLDSENAFRRITRFGSCLKEKCMFWHKCREGDIDDI
jgi:hypothetical protein